MAIGGDGSMAKGCCGSASHPAIVALANFDSLDMGTFAGKLSGAEFTGASAARSSSEVAANANQR